MNFEKREALREILRGMIMADKHPASEEEIEAARRRAVVTVSRLARGSDIGSLGTPIFLVELQKERPNRLERISIAALEEELGVSLSTRVSRRTNFSEGTHPTRYCISISHEELLDLLERHEPSPP